MCRDVRVMRARVRYTRRRANERHGSHDEIRRAAALVLPGGRCGPVTKFHGIDATQEESRRGTVRAAVANHSLAKMSGHSVYAVCSIVPMDERAACQRRKVLTHATGGEKRRVRTAEKRRGGV